MLDVQIVMLMEFGKMEAATRFFEPWIVDPAETALICFEIIIHARHITKVPKQMMPNFENCQCRKYHMRNPLYRRSDAEMDDDSAEAS